MEMTKARRKLLVELERLVSTRWNNASHSAYGFIQNETKRPLWLHEDRVARGTVATVSDDHLLCLSYRAGPFEFAIFRALDEIVGHLERERGLKV